MSRARIAPLGALIHSRKPRYAQAAGLVAVAALAAVIVWLRRDYLGWSSLAPALTFPAVIAVLLWHERDALAAVDFFENAIVLRWPHASRTVPVADVREIEFGGVRHMLWNGVVPTLRLTPAEGRPITLADLPEAFEKMARFASLVTAAVCSRMEAELEARGEVPWGRSAWLTPEGVRFRRRGWLGRSADGFARFGPEVHGRAKDGVFALFAGDAETPAFRMGTGEPNWAAGFVLCNRLLEGAMNGSFEISDPGFGETPDCNG